MPTATMTSKRKVLTVGIPTVALLLGVTALITIKLRHPKPPPVDSAPEVLAKFVATYDFDALPDAAKSPYREVLRKQTRDLALALKANKITHAEYDQAFLNGWLARQLDHMGDFYRLPIATREQLWIQRYREKVQTSIKSPDPEPDDEIERLFLKRVVRKWDSDTRAKWDEYRAVNKKAKKITSTPATAARGH